MTDTIERIDPPNAADEATMLAAWLDFHRKTLALKTSGLTDDQLKQRSVTPSTLTLLGLVRHLAEVEHYWYQVILLGGESTAIYGTDEDQDFDFNGVAQADAAADLATWRRQVELSEQAVAGLSLDTLAAVRRRSGEQVTLRWIQVHLIEEYARHNGHADLLREAVDGVTGE
ncbi:DinB family protein [Kitasatospora kifunensis]|uniref:Putative damage-inducible protein DinB n=1 Tax=Kitasatospora kifunensis TaxID=58351 RepID=A0A7W7VY03_KITKI|nr:DinB family protein [Kitasatospora kifunensis]MBB4927046.1 putative damage-inducible protein DinB [Kitasatospora kifunensis]